MSMGSSLSKCLRVPAFLCLSCLACLPLGGCLMVANSNSSVQGREVGKQTLQHVEPGKTTKAWLIAAIGNPSSETKVDESTQILRYDWSQTKKDNLSIFVLLSGDNSVEMRHSVCFEVKDGVIQRHWQETIKT